MNSFLIFSIVRHSKVERRCFEVAPMKIMVLKGGIQKRRNLACKAIREQEATAVARLALSLLDKPKRKRKRSRTPINLSLNLSLSSERITESFVFSVTTFEFFNWKASHIVFVGLVLLFPWVLRSLQSEVGGKDVQYRSWPNCIGQTCLYSRRALVQRFGACGR